MAVRIDGNNDLINAADGSLTIEGISVNVVGVSTASGGFKVGTAYTVFPNGNVATAGVVTASSFIGSGANLTGITQTTITGNANNRVITGSDTSNTLIAESGLTYDTQVLRLNNTSANPQFHLTSADDGISELKFGDQSDTTRAVILYRSGSAGDALCFNGYNNTERMRITSGGQVGIASETPRTGFKLDVNGDLSLGESGGTDNTYLEQKQDGDFHIINSGRSADGGSNTGGAGGIGINRYNTLAGGTSNFRDLAVYNGKNSKVLVVDGSASSVGIGTDAPDAALTISKASSSDMLTFNVPGSVGTFAKLGHNTSSGTSILDVRSEGHVRFLSGGNNERLRIQSDGTTIDQFISQNGGININVTSGSDCAAQIRGKADRSATGNTLLSLHGDWNGTAVTMMDFQAGDDTTNKDDGTIDFYTRPSGGSMTHRLRIDHNGDVIMGNTGAFNSNSDISPCFAIGSSAHDRPGIVIRGSSTNKGDISFCDNSGSDSSDGVSEGLLRYDHDGDNMIFHTSDVERMRITNSSGGTGTSATSVRIGTTSAIHHTEDCFNVLGGGDSGVALVAKSNGNGAVIMAYSNYNVAKNFTGQNQSGSTTFSVTGAGALSKSSGSFRIDHPLVGMSTSHYLQHSFIEGPQADLIYRGVVTLSSGVASINIDTVSGMTEGTFVKLCTDVSCFTSNESDWIPVKGSVSGNVLTITAQDNTSTATVSWLVIGERQDDHMKDGNTNWTNSDGKVIVEILKTDVD